MVLPFERLRAHSADILPFVAVRQLVLGQGRGISEHFAANLDRMAEEIKRKEKYMTTISQFPGDRMRCGCIISEKKVTFCGGGNAVNIESRLAGVAPNWDRVFDLSYEQLTAATR